MEVWFGVELLPPRCSLSSSRGDRTFLKWSSMAELKAEAFHASSMFFLLALNFFENYFEFKL